MATTDLKVPTDPHQVAASRDNYIRQSRSNAATIQGALGDVEREAQDAEQAYADAWSKGDGLGVAKAQRTISDTVSRKHTLQAGLDELAGSARQPTFEEMLAGMPQLRPDERDWLRKHPDALVDPMNQQRLQIAYQDAERKGLERGSEDYFSFFDDRLGYKTKEPESWAPARQRGSDNGGTGAPKLKPGQVLLTEEQRSFARASGVSEEEYARGVQELRKYKAQGMYGMDERA